MNLVVPGLFNFFDIFLYDNQLSISHILSQTKRSFADGPPVHILATDQNGDSDVGDIVMLVTL